MLDTNFIEQKKLNERNVSKEWSESPFLEKL
jgi:hypothetical protein